MIINFIPDTEYNPDAFSVRSNAADILNKLFPDYGWSINESVIIAGAYILDIPDGSDTSFLSQYGEII